MVQANHKDLTLETKNKNYDLRYFADQELRQEEQHTVTPHTVGATCCMLELCQRIDKLMVVFFWLCCIMTKKRTRIPVRDELVY